ncbi:MAG: helix-turn-helix transcriptional regulator [Tistlia sp.]|uniref:helix-turn-helix domain-containing protein n=1 Tax=Tistlia sp. TaxID=3057121 RepID=UPI0034A5C70B
MSDRPAVEVNGAIQGGTPVDQLARLRVVLGLSAAKVDRLAHWREGTCRGYESGRRPSYERLLEWYAALGAEPVIPLPNSYMIGALLQRTPQVAAPHATAPSASESKTSR